MGVRDEGKVQKWELKEAKVGTCGTLNNPDATESRAWIVDRNKHTTRANVAQPPRDILIPNSFCPDPFMPPAINQLLE